MNGYSLTPPAKADIKEIWEWVSVDNPEAADQLAQEILTACQRLAEHPDTGSRRPVWTHRPLRFLLVRKNYFIVYSPATRPLQILRVLHASRDISAVLAAGS